MPTESAALSYRPDNLFKRLFDQMSASPARQAVFIKYSLMSTGGLPFRD
jgi:hypothetical protein